MDLHRSLWIYMALCGSVWFFVDIYRFSMALCGSVWFSVDIYRFSMVLCGSLWFSIALYGSLSLSMVLYLLPDVAGLVVHGEEGQVHGAGQAQGHLTQSILYFSSNTV